MSEPSPSLWTSPADWRVARASETGRSRPERAPEPPIRILPERSGARPPARAPRGRIHAGQASWLARARGGKGEAALGHSNAHRVARFFF